MYRRFSVDYEEFLCIIKGYILGLLLSRKLIINSDLFLALESLTNFSIDILELRSLANDFFSKIDMISTSFSHVKREGYILVYLLAMNAIYFDLPLEWTRDIPYDVIQTILFDFNKFDFPLA